MNRQYPRFKNFYCCVLRSWGDGRREGEEEASRLRGGANEVRGREAPQLTIIGNFLLIRSRRVIALESDDVIELSGTLGNPSSQIGKCECFVAVATKGVANQREQGGVLSDLQKLALAKGPVPRRKIVRNKKNLPDKWFGHGVFPF